MILLCVTACLGLLAVYASSQVYATTAVARWTTGYPGLAFAASTFVLGAPAVLLLRSDLAAASRRRLLLLFTLGVVLLIVHAGLTGRAELALPRYVLAGAGVALGICVYVREDVRRGICAAALVCLLLGELLGRYSFFME